MKNRRHDTITPTGLPCRPLTQSNLTVNRQLVMMSVDWTSNQPDIKSLISQSVNVEVIGLLIWFNRCRGGYVEISDSNARGSNEEETEDSNSVMGGGSSSHKPDLHRWEEGHTQIRVCGEDQRLHPPAVIFSDTGNSHNRVQVRRVLYRNNLTNVNYLLLFHRHIQIYVWIESNGNRIYYKKQGFIPKVLDDECKSKEWIAQKI